MAQGRIHINPHHPLSKSRSFAFNPSIGQTVVAASAVVPAACTMAKGPGPSPPRRVNPPRSTDGSLQTPPSSWNDWVLNRWLFRAPHAPGTKETTIQTEQTTEIHF